MTAITVLLKIKNKKKVKFEKPPAVSYALSNGKTDALSVSALNSIIHKRNLNLTQKILQELRLQLNGFNTRSRQDRFRG